VNQGNEKNNVERFHSLKFTPLNPAFFLLSNVPNLPILPLDNNPDLFSRKVAFPMKIPLSQTLANYNLLPLLNLSLYK